MSHPKQLELLRTKMAAWAITQILVATRNLDQAGWQGYFLHKTIVLQLGEVAILSNIQKVKENEETRDYVPNKKQDICLETNLNKNQVIYLIENLK